MAPEIKSLIRYALFFPSRGKGQYYSEEDGGAYCFSYGPTPDTLRNSPEEARKDCPPASFGKGEVHKIEVRATTYPLGHLPASLNRTPKNKWVAKCSRCGLSSNGAKSTIQFALDNVKKQYEQYPVCGTEEYIDLGKV